MAGIVAHETGGENQVLAEQLLVIFEGATSAASYRGARAVDAARSVAKSLVRRP